MAEVRDSEMPERKYVEVNGKKYPLKTDAERQTSKQDNDEPESSNRSVSVKMPSVSNGGQRQVLLAMTVAFLVFVAAGGKVEKVIAKARGEKEPASDKAFTAGTIFAWGFLLIALMVMADLNATSDLAVAFSYLILLSVMLQFGPEAFTNIQKLTNTQGSK